MKQHDEVLQLKLEFIKTVMEQLSFPKDTKAKSLIHQITNSIEDLPHISKELIKDKLAVINKLFEIYFTSLKTELNNLTKGSGDIATLALERIFEAPEIDSAKARTDLQSVLISIAKVTKSYLEYANEDVLKMILSYLPAQDLARMGRVNTKFAKMTSTDELWKPIMQRLGIPLELNSNFKQAFFSLKNRCFAAFPHLPKVTAYSNTNLDPKKFLDFVLPYFKNKQIMQINVTSPNLKLLLDKITTRNGCDIYYTGFFIEFDLCEKKLLKLLQTNPTEIVQHILALHPTDNHMSMNLGDNLPAIPSRYEVPIDLRNFHYQKLIRDSNPSCLVM